VPEYPTLVAYADRIRRTWFTDQLDNTKQIWQVEGTGKAAAGAGKAEALPKPEKPLHDSQSAKLGQAWDMALWTLVCVLVSRGGSEALA
jgi:hypothetical protein